jgi:hypothetical protein
MRPSKSNNKENCSPTSSNCVVWQGPDIACINLCTGDSVSDVVYKLAEEICALKDNAGISDVELTCLVDTCTSSVPEPVKTLSNILQLLIDKVCCIDQFVKDINIPDDPYQEPTLTLPCAYLQYSDGMGGTVTQLPLSQYVVRLATMICDLNTRVTDNTSDIDALDVRVTALEEATDDPVQIDSCLTGTLVDIEDAVEYLEEQFCSYVTALGPVSKINQIAPLQCVPGTDIALSTGSPMALLPGWESTVSNMAQSLKNLWATVCDIRSAVKLIQETCCKINCDSIVIDFGFQWIDATSIRLLFNGRTTIPQPFYDCLQPAGTAFTFTDGLGNVAIRNILFRENGGNSGIMDDITLTPSRSVVIEELDLDGLDTTTGLTVTADPCFTDGTVNCIKCFNKVIPGYVNTDCCTLTGVTAPVTITYKYCISPVV